MPGRWPRTAPASRRQQLKAVGAQVTLDELRNMATPFVRLATGEMARIVDWYPDTKAVAVKAPNGRLHVLPVGCLLPGPGFAVEQPY